MLTKYRLLSKQKVTKLLSSYSLTYTLSQQGSGRKVYHTVSSIFFLGADDVILLFVAFYNCL